MSWHAFLPHSWLLILMCVSVLNLLLGLLAGHRSLRETSIAQLFQMPIFMISRTSPSRWANRKGKREATHRTALRTLSRKSHRRYLRVDVCRQHHWAYGSWCTMGRYFGVFSWFFVLDGAWWCAMIYHGNNLMVLPRCKVDVSMNMFSRCTMEFHDCRWFLKLLMN